MKWPTLKINRFCKTGSGGTPSTRKKDIYYGGDIPWVKSGELKDDVLLSTEETLTDLGLAESAAKWIPAGSVLIAMYGATIGKTALLGLNATTNQAVCNVIPNPQVADNRYVWYAIRHSVPQLIAKRVGGAQPNISQKIISQTPLPLPPISEQRRIVEILDQADALRRKRAEADAKAARILPALFYKMFGDPATNPKGWPVMPIHEMVDTVKRRDPSNQPDEPFIYLDIAGVNGRLGVITDAKTLTGAEAPSRARQIIRANDIIVSTVRPYLRATALVPLRYDNQICSTGFCILRAKSGEGFGFLYTLSRLQWFTDQLNARARGASYPAVTDRNILDLRVPRPDNRQALKRFDRRVLDILELEEKRRRLATRLEDLFDTLFHRAFTGDLTTKWREAHMKDLLAEMEAQAKALNPGIEP